MDCDILKLDLYSKECMPVFDEKSILITGGTGSFGKKFIEILLQKYTPKKVIVYSRDELKQFEMQQKFKQSCMRHTTGRIRVQARQPNGRGAAVLRKRCACGEGDVQRRSQTRAL